MPSFTIKIGGVDLPSGVKVASKSLSINYAESGTRGVCAFTLVDKNLTGTLFYFTAISGKSVEIYEDGILIYGGKIETPKTRKITYGNQPMISQKITCVDHHAICDRIYINKSYPKYTVDTLIKTIIDDYLAIEGITYDASSIMATTTTISINCSNASCTDIFKEITEYVGWQWFIAPDKKLYFNDRTSDVGDELNEATAYLADTIELEDDMSEYYNKNILTDVHAVTDELTETASPKPDDTHGYYVRFKLNNKPKIYITDKWHLDNPRTSDLVDPHYVGINGLDEGMHWYWNKNENLITQDNEQEPIADEMFVVVKYYGQYQIDIVEQDSSEISARQAIEGGSGVYTNVESGASIEGIDVAEEKSQAMLARYAKVAKKIKVSSYNHSWKNGQICNCIFPTFGINSLVVSGDGFLVTSLNIKDTGIHLLRTATLIDGEAIGGWVKFFKRWMKESSPNIILREDALVEIDLSYEVETDWEGTIVVNRYDCLYPSNSLYPSSTLYPGTLDTSNTYYD